MSLIPAKTLYNRHISPVKKKDVKSGGLSKICEKSVFLLFRVTQLFLTLWLFQPQSLQRLLILLLLTYILSSSLSPYTSTHNLCLPLISQDNSTSGPGFLLWIPYPIISVLKMTPRFCYTPKCLSLCTVCGQFSGSFVLFGGLPRGHTASTVCPGQ